MPVILFLASLLVFGCASKSVDLKGRTVSNYLEDAKLTELNAHQRLNLLIQNIEELKDTMDRTNPRYYLFENFLERTQELLTEASSYNGNSMEENVWVPNDIAVAPKFHRIVAAYEVMDKASGYLKLDPYVVGFDKNVNLNLDTLDYILGEYKKAIDSLRADGLASVTVEAYKKIKARETRDLMHYLARRIEAHSEGVVSSNRHRKRIKKLTDWVLDTDKLSGKSPERFLETLSRLKKSWTFRKGIWSLTNRVEFPDSGNIEGADDSFNQVHSVQVCGEIMAKVTASYLRDNK